MWGRCSRGFAGAQVAVIGVPNAGKSTLTNKLVGQKASPDVQVPESLLSRRPAHAFLCICLVCSGLYAVMLMCMLACVQLPFFFFFFGVVQPLVRDRCLRCRIALTRRKTRTWVPSRRAQRRSRCLTHPALSPPGTTTWPFWPGMRKHAAHAHKMSKHTTTSSCVVRSHHCVLVAGKLMDLSPATLLHGRTATVQLCQIECMGLVYARG